MSNFLDFKLTFMPKYSRDSTMNKQYQPGGQAMRRLAKK